MLQGPAQSENAGLLAQRSSNTSRQCQLSVGLDVGPVECPHACGSNVVPRKQRTTARQSFLPPPCSRVQTEAPAPSGLADQRPGLGSPLLCTPSVPRPPRRPDFVAVCLVKRGQQETCLKGLQRDCGPPGHPAQLREHLLGEGSREEPGLGCCGPSPVSRRAGRPGEGRQLVCVAGDSCPPAAARLSPSPWNPR